MSISPPRVPEPTKRNKLIVIAEGSPEDKYNFKLQNGRRSFAENLLHIAVLDYDWMRGSKSNIGPYSGKNKRNQSRHGYKRMPMS